MANIVQIKDIYLYVAFTENGAAECGRIIKLFKDNKLPFITLSYADDDVGQKNVLDALNTWNLGDLANPYKINATDFPILQWTECYDDWSTQVHLAQGWDAMKKSTCLSGVYPLAPIAKPPT